MLLNGAVFCHVFLKRLYYFLDMILSLQTQRWPKIKAARIRQRGLLQALSRRENFLKPHFLEK